METDKLNLGQQTAFFALNDFPQRISLIKPDKTTETRYMLGTLVIIPPVVEIGDRTPLALGPMRGAMENAIDECLRECAEIGHDCDMHEGHNVRHPGHHDLHRDHHDGHHQEHHDHGPHQIHVETHACAYMKTHHGNDSHRQNCEDQYQPTQTLGGTVLEVYKCKGYGLRKHQLGNPKKTVYEMSYNK